MITPEQDLMLLEKKQKKSMIQLLKEDANNPREMIPFKILAIGPGTYNEAGVFVKATHKPGQLVFINGPIIATEYNGIKYIFGREKDVVATLMGEDLNVD